MLKDPVIEDAQRLAKRDKFNSAERRAVADKAEARGLDSVMLTDSSRVRDGLELMLTAAIGKHGYILGHVDAQVALLVIEAAKRADDRSDWFPQGKWATVQAMHARTEHELKRMFCAA